MQCIQAQNIRTFYRRKRARILGTLLFLLTSIVMSAESQPKEGITHIK